MLTRLFSSPHAQVPLEGAYLALDLHKQADPGNIVIYANFIASVDGRIALRDTASGELEVPAAIANARDWRLYQELAAQSEIMIVSARYLRQLAAGTAQDLLPVGDGDAYEDLRQWRAEQGLSVQPDVLVVSRSLDIPAAALDRITGRRIIVVTTEDADESKLALLKGRGIDVVSAGLSSVQGRELRQTLVRMGYCSAYMIAGPAVHRMLLAGNSVNRLFLTTRHCLLGGESFSTILEAKLASPVQLILNEMYLDAEGGQHFADYRVEYPYD